MTTFNNIKRGAQRGFALGEMLLAVALVAVLVGIGAAVYSSVRGGISADDAAAKAIALASDIQKNWRNAGTFASVSAAEANKLGLIQKPLKFDGTTLTDAWGNTMSLNGGTNSFALTIGGTANALSKDNCAAIANRLANGVATNINIGATAAVGTGANLGNVTGGNAFKTGSTINQANLATGCNEANPVIAASFR